MKMVKSLLLGTAAGLVAVTAGQAADLPVKAKPVEYVKVCSLYGAGFYYMPGTDLCLKIGGWVRAEAVWGTNGNFAWGPFNGNQNSRATNNLAFRGRGYITADAREQTAYGTARGYIAVGVSTNDVGLNTAANQFSANRAFVQFAGITAGISQSFYDYYSVPATSYSGDFGASDTGDPGWTVFGYTAQLGNGMSATLAVEQRRTTQIIDASGLAVSGAAGSAAAGNINIGGFTTTIPGVSANNGAYGGMQMGDIVGNIRLDQAWGGAQIMGALHDVNATYYSSAVGGGPAAGFPVSGHPGDSWGWAAGAGLRLNFPMIGQGDYLQTQVNYTEGAARYVMFTPDSNWGKQNGSQIAYGVLSDCVYGGIVSAGTSTGCQLTTAWGFNAAYEHHWSPAWQTSLFGGWDAISYNSSANAMLCSAAGFGSGTGGGALANAGCNNDWSTWFIGSRTQWNVSKTFYMGVEVMYSDLKSASTGSTAIGGYNGCTTLTTAAGCGGAGGFQTESSASNWQVRFRMHKDFLP
ncbi:MAG TPA: porin [Xanthobacteraceae bacterium]|nr:porin [Xanthobacteraceae bacterium]